MNQHRIPLTGPAGTRDVWSIEGSAPLQSTLERPECPPLLRQALKGTVSWQTRNETSVHRVLASPRIAPQWVAALLAWGASVVCEGEEQPLVDFLLHRGTRPRLEALRVPSSDPNRTWGESHVARTPADPPIVAAIAVTDWTDPLTVRQARLALTGVWRTPAQLAESADMLVGGRLSDEQIGEVALAVQLEVSPPDNFLGSANYRREMAAVLTRRALEACRNGVNQ